MNFLVRIVTGAELSYRDIRERASYKQQCSGRSIIIQTRSRPSNPLTALRHYLTQINDAIPLYWIWGVILTAMASSWSVFCVDLCGELTVGRASVGRLTLVQSQFGISRIKIRLCHLRVTRVTWVTRRQS